MKYFQHEINFVQIHLYLSIKSQSAMTTSISPVITATSTILNVTSSPKRAHPSSPHMVTTSVNSANQVTLHSNSSITGLFFPLFTVR